IDQLVNYVVVLIGTYTWDDGEFPYEAEDFYIDLEGTYLTGQIFGVYGSADSFYDTYGLAIQLMGDRLKNLCATMIPDRFIVDLTPDKKDEARCSDFAKLVTNTMNTETKQVI